MPAGVLQRGLFAACIKGQLQVVRYLVERNVVDLRLYNARGRSALALAIRNNRTAVVELLVAQVDYDVNAIVEVKMGYTAVMVAAQCNACKALRMVLDAAARRCQTVRLAMTDSFGRTATILAAESPACLRVLLEAGASPGSTQRSTLRSALYYAAKAGSLESMKLLLAYGASPAHTDLKGQLPFDVCATAECRQLLLEYKQRTRAAQKVCTILLALSTFRRYRQEANLEQVPRDVWRMLALAVWRQRID